MNGFRNASYAMFVLMLAGLVVIGYGLYNLSLEKEFDRKGEMAYGIVYELAVTEPYRQAMVQFATKDGKIVHFLDKLYWNHSFEKYKVGQQVSVIYDPADPEKTATIDEFFQRNTAPWWPVIVGGIAFFAGLILRISLLKKARQFDMNKNRGYQQ